MNVSELQAFATALFIGALVGVERTHRRPDDQGGLAGLRTFTLLAELGAVLAWISEKSQSPTVFLGGLLAIAATIAAGYVVQQRSGNDSPGMTTEVAGLVVYALGGLTVYGQAPLAVALAIVTAGLLAMKSALHQAVRRISHLELMATLRLLFASFIVLPLLPNAPIDPWAALNPYKLWLLVIFISGLSMIGYVATRVVGASRGTLLAGLFGGIVSSTATTLAFSKQSKEHPELSPTLAGGTLLAWVVMYVRVTVLVGALRWPLLPHVAFPLLSMGAAGALTALWVVRHPAGTPTPGSSEVLYENPFRFWPAIKFAALFAVVLLAAKLTQHYAPGVGLYWLSGLAGSTDVDAITLSLTEIHERGEATDSMAVIALVIAAAANTLFKLGLIIGLGQRQMWVLLVPATLAMLTAGALAVAFNPW